VGSGCFDRNTEGDLSKGFLLSSIASALLSNLSSGILSDLFLYKPHRMYPSLYVYNLFLRARRYRNEGSAAAPLNKTSPYGRIGHNENKTRDGPLYKRAPLCVLCH